MTMAAHEIPAVPPPPPFAFPSSSNREYIESTTPNTADAVLKIAKEASEAFKNVPYIRALSGIIIQVIDIREEIQTEKDRSKELIEKILRRSGVILESLLQVVSSPNRDQLKDIESKLTDYNDLLGKILEALKAHTSKRVFDRIVHRKSRLGDLEKYDRLINDFNTDFATDLQIRSHLTRHTSLPDPTYYPPVLPPPSGLMIGRDKEKSQVLSTLLDKTPARVAILGAGGMGKTTLALSSLHEPAVVERFPSRYFVSCEAVTSASALIREIANALRIPPGKRDENLIDLIISSFHCNSVLCLDNFETIWDNETTRLDVEGLLAHLNHLPQLAMIVTMRGTQRPFRVSWSKPILPPLTRLSYADSKLIFETICGEVDVFVEKLLKATDGILLAVTLVSALLQEGNETSEFLWLRWEKTRTTVIGNGGKDRRFNLDTSIHLSVYGPRMQADPCTIPILAMLSMLPEGFPYTPAIDELQRHMPGDNDLWEALLTMRRVSLLYVDESNTPPRLRMLTPIRHFCGRRLKAPEILRRALASFYIKIINDFTDVTDSAGHAIVPAELGNMYAVLVETCKFRRGDHAVVRACIGYTKWALYTGTPMEGVIRLAMEGVVGTPSLLADCHFELPNVYIRLTKIYEAQESLECAVRLHRQALDVLGEANDLQKLGDLHLRRARLNEAQESFERAVQLHRQAHDVLGEATDVQRLGDVHLRRDNLDEAQESYERAVQLHRHAHDVPGEATDVKRLGDVYMRRDNLDDAQKSFERAVELHRQAHDVLGEATDVKRLGDVHVRRDNLNEAQESFERAVQLHRQAHDVLGEATDVRSLGDVHMQRDKLDEAQDSFMRAVQLHRQAHDVLGEATDVQSLGEVHLRQDKLDDAQKSFELAVQLHRQAHSVLGEAHGVLRLGDVHLRRNELDEAEKFFDRALQLHSQAHDVLSEATDVQRLGEVHLRRDKLDEAQESFERPIQLHKQAHSVLSEATDVQRLGEVHLRRGKLDDARFLFENALKLYQQSQSNLGVANSCQSLGRLYLRQNNLHEAGLFLNRALLLHQQCQASSSEAADLRLIQQLKHRLSTLPLPLLHPQQPSAIPPNSNSRSTQLPGQKGLLEPHFSHLPRVRVQAQAQQQSRSDVPSATLKVSAHPHRDDLPPGTRTETARLVPLSLHVSAAEPKSTPDPVLEGSFNRRRPSLNSPTSPQSRPALCVRVMLPVPESQAEGLQLDKCG